MSKKASGGVAAEFKRWQCKGRAKTSCASPKERLLWGPSEASATIVPTIMLVPDPVLARSLPSPAGDNKQALV